MKKQQPLPLFQQVSGSVTDESGDPLIGATVIEKDTAHGTVTDLNGKFSLRVDIKDPILVFSYFGYEPQTVQVDNQPTVNVTLEASNIP